MVQIMQDKYILGQSNSGKVQTNSDEIQLDLSLQPNTKDITGGNISGTVTDSVGIKISNAYIKLMTTAYDPVMHAITDTKGNYSLVNVPAGNYTIFARAKGMELNQGNTVTVTNYQDYTINFTLSPDPSSQLGIIAGDLTNKVTKEIIAGAVVTLFLKPTTGANTLIAITYTNEYGQFVFREIPKGNYVIDISALGYENSEVTTEVTTAGQIIPIDATLSPSANISKGTVSGVIINNKSVAVNEADVVLYEVNNTTQVLTPISFTKTNKNGVYLFINVPQGSYKVKSNKLSLTNVEVGPIAYSPDFYSFTISTPTTYIPLQINAIQGVLSNGATIDKVNNFVTDLGGSTNGTVTVKVNIEITANYTLGIQYVTTTQGTKLQVQVNGGSILSTNTLPVTNGLTQADAKTINLTIPLNSGINSIKIFNTNAVAPNVNKLFFTMLPLTLTTSAINGTVAGGAYVQGDFVLFIGGTTGVNHGSVTVSVNVSLAGKYNMKIEYQSGDGPRVLEIDVNGASTGQSYTVPQTNGWETPGYYNVTLFLKKGQNTIKFYNNNAYAPNVGGLDFTQELVLQVYKAENTTVIPPATIKNGLVTGIASGKGSLNFITDIPGKGDYDFIINYVSDSDNTSTNININGVFTGKTYTFKKTSSMNLVDAKNKLISLELDFGDNIIKIYNAT